MTNQPVDVYLEFGKKRSVAGAAAYLGWCRIGKNEEAALASLLAYGPRFAAVFAKAGIPFSSPTELSQFNEIERLPGNATTNFGAPGVVPNCDQAPISEGELAQYLSLIQTAYQGFDQAVSMAIGKELRKGPRGGGRDLDRIISHVIEADRSYLPRVAWTFKRDKTESMEAMSNRMRQTVQEALISAVRNGLPEKGPRGGLIWPARYYVRRVVWHILDHQWEIEDRILNDAIKR
jgi:hypothetical protein